MLSGKTPPTRRLPIVVGLSGGSRVETVSESWHNRDMDESSCIQTFILSLYHDQRTALALITPMELMGGT